MSTAGDLHAMLRAMYRDNVVKAATWHTLFPLEDSLFSYQGRCPGYNVVMWRDFARDVDVVVLCNNYAAGMVADVALDLTRIAAGESRPPARWRGDVPADSVAAHALVGRWHITTGASLPYGSGPFGVAWRPGGLVFSIGDTPVDYMLPQADGGYLLRNLWSEVRFDTAPGGAPQPTIRPLWFKANATPLTRLE